MAIELDFIKQLTTTKAVKEENIINKKHIKENYNSLIDSAFLFGKSMFKFEILQISHSSIKARAFIGSKI